MNQATRLRFGQNSEYSAFALLGTMSKWWCVGLLALMAAMPVAKAHPGPQAPSELQGHYDTATDSFVISWMAEEAVAFRVYRDGALVGTVDQPIFEDTDLPEVSGWTYQVTAVTADAESLPTTLVVLRSGEISGRDGPLAKTHGPVMPRGLPVPEYCTLSTLGWRPNPPFLFSVDVDCIRYLIGGF